MGMKLYVEYENGMGQKRYQPKLPSGERLWNDGTVAGTWSRPVPSNSWGEEFEPRLFKSARRAQREAEFEETDRYLKKIRKFREVER